MMTFFKRILNNKKLLFVLCLFSLVLPNFLLFFTEQMPLLGRLCNIVLPTSVFWYLMAIGRKPGKVYLCLFLFIFFNAFQIVLLYLFGNSVIAVDMFLNLVTTNPGEAGELLSNIFPSVIFVIVLYVPLLLWSIYSLKSDDYDNAFFKVQRKCAKYGFVVSAVLLLACYFVDKNYKAENDLYPVNVMYNVGLAVEREVRVANYFNTSQNFAFNSICTRSVNEKELYVLVIGETARAANFGIYGYERNTTPLLGCLNDLIVFKDAFTQSNTTHKSVPMIMSAVSAENFNDIYAQKGIITAFNEAGYSTAFFSNQRRNHSFIDFFGEEADTCKFVKEFLPEETNVSDEVLLEYTKQYLGETTSNKLFIVLHSYGSHFDYTERYPADKAYYKPDKAPSATFEYKEQLVNAYDNTIRATDDFLFRLIKIVEAQNVSAAVMYVSDHGEDIYDDERKLFLHASPIPSEYQLHVPFFVWTSQKYIEQNPQQCESLLSNTNANISTNLAVFHTLLDMAGITTFYKKDHFALSNKYFEANKFHTYLNDHNESVPVSEICH